MDTKKQLELYANLMAEVKLRIECIDNAVQGRTGLPNPIVREFCYLQLRLLCELIALACMVAHGDIRSLQSHQIGRSTAAHDILAHLEKLRPHFYPLAAKQKAEDHKTIDLISDKSPLPKPELLRLYGACHRHLHRGNLKTLLTSKDSFDLIIDVPEIIDWGQKINDLLAIHFIPINENEVIGCILRTYENNNKVQVFTAVKTDSYRMNDTKETSASEEKPLAYGA